MKTNHNFLEKILINLFMNFESFKEFLFDVEKFFFLKKNSNQDLKCLFISGLPRSGTTSALNCFYKNSNFASLTYDDLPFLICPNLALKWKKFFKKKIIQSFERAHKDNILINTSSPEAFEEFFWKKETKKNYIKEFFLLKNNLTNSNIIEFKKYVELILTRYNKKIYLSKNNNNILRMSDLLNGIKNSMFLIFFRDPLHQSASLLNQHNIFSKIHKENKFALKYMNYLGHYEFGENTKRFDIGIYKYNDPFDINYWLEVWINYYYYVINNFQKERVALICYEDLAENSNEYLKSKINEKEFIENINFSEFKNMNKFVNAKVNDKIKEEAYIVYSKLRELN
ncbi:MAG: hypothetical protein H8E55_24425 [Pelagibacterales bacterium]|nr:hypothetical protein [Pelagibacterales bacterium]